MFRYAIVLLLISPYYYSLGSPIQPLLVSLKTLSSHCENSFLTTKIVEKINNCNISLLKTSEIGLRCMMFYDINSQLCSAYKNSKVNLEEDFNKNFPKSTDVKAICNDVQTWEFGTLLEFPKYKLVTDRVVKNQLICLSICKEDDILSDESNFYCKYFKWGSHLIHNEKIALNQDTNKELNSKVEQINKSLTNITTTTNNASEVNSTQKSKDVALKDVDNKVKVKNNEKVNLNVTKKPLSQTDIPAGSAAIFASIINMSSNTANEIVSMVSQSEKTSAVNQDKQPSVEEPPKTGTLGEITKINKENLHTGLDTHVSNNEPIIESPKSLDPDDGQDDDIGNDLDSEDDDTIGDQDNGIQDGDGQNLNDPKLEMEKPKSSEKKIESITSLSEDILQKEIFPNTIQDTFVEDDDHFFPFFLTSIILVILLYILYHNKNKFTKVILGLIVEGRQSGRRRNSRGHSYRRLDTLEQAMSSNTAAPPSKIIY